MSMQYRPFGKTGKMVSALGFGCMRLPTLDGPSGAQIDEEEAIRMIRHAIDEGLNYVDTAFMYHGGNSEGLVGKALRDGYRDKTWLATKSPFGGFRKPEDFDEHLSIQLERLQQDYVDFYMLHAACLQSWKEVALPFKLLDKLEKARADGKIRHIGFSFHDDYNAFQTIVDGYDGWDFCQIQLNYLDVENQAGIRGLEYAADKGLAVIIMEPLLGGKLANPPENVRRVLPPDKSPVELALDFLWNRPEVSLILSGMSTMQQVDDNLAYASRCAAGMLSESDLKVYTEAKKVFDTMARVPCTRCTYCMPCPFGVDIPGVFEAYNKSVLDMDGAKSLYAGLDGHADLCRACHKCERICPQHIAVSERMPEIQAFFAD